MAEKSYLGYLHDTKIKAQNQDMEEIKMSNMVKLASYYDYNFRRYSKPWACEMTPLGKYDFSHDVAIYTGNARAGEGGDLVLIDPEIGQVYAYGQKDYRKPRSSEINYVRWDGEQLIPCDKLGREKEAD